MKCLGPNFQSGVVIEQTPWAVSPLPQRVVGEWFQDGDNQRTLQIFNASILSFDLQLYNMSERFIYQTSISHCEPQPLTHKFGNPLACKKNEQTVTGLIFLLLFVV